MIFVKDSYLHLIVTSLFVVSKQANLVAAFEQSLALMTTRLQSLSVSHEQKVIWQPQTQTHKPESQLHSTIMSTSWWWQRCANTEWDDFDHSLRWGAECRLEAQTVAPHRRQQDLWGKKIHFRLNDTSNFSHMDSHQTSRSCILQLLYLFWCEWIDQCLRQCSLCVYKCEESLLVLHALMLSLKGPSRPLQEKKNNPLCCLRQCTDLCSSAWITGSLTLRRLTRWLCL